jgi:hypothetical protein
VFCAEILQVDPQYLLVRFFRTGVAGLGSLDSCLLAEAGCDEWVFIAVDGFSNFQSAGDECIGVFIATECTAAAGEVIKNCGGFGMIGSECGRPVISKASS